VLSYDPERAGEGMGAAGAGAFPPGDGTAQRVHPASGVRRHAAALLMVTYLLAAGVFLVVVPWSDLWSHNSLVARAPLQLRELWRSGAFRGAVTGFGLAHFVFAFVEVLALRREGSGGG